MSDTWGEFPERAFPRPAIGPLSPRAQQRRARVVHPLKLAVPTPINADVAAQTTERALTVAVELTGRQDWLSCTAAEITRGRSFGLEPRELRILKRSAHGQQAPTIAAELGLSRFAVDHAIRRVKDRLGVQTLSHAVACLVAARAIHFEADSLSATPLVRAFPHENLRSQNGT
jgi:DNA-binding CsgD family transcriptional regulator